MPIIESLAAGAANTAVNTGLGLLLEGHQDRRQLRQQGKLARQQAEIDREQYDYQQQKQLEFWKATSYGGQMEQLEKAGLNPGLVYGMGGAGGATVGGGIPSVNSAKAPQGGGEILGLQMLGAQKALIEAQTAKTTAEATKIAGVDTQSAEQDLRLKTMQTDMYSNTYAETYAKIKGEAGKAAAEAGIKEQEWMILNDTREERIKLIQGELIGLGLVNELRKEQIELTQEQIKQTVENISQRWEELSIQKRRMIIEGDKLALERFIRDIPDSTRLALDAVKTAVNIAVMKN